MRLQYCLLLRTYTLMVDGKSNDVMSGSSLSGVMVGA